LPVVARADPVRLGTASAWGSYYDRDPIASRAGFVWRSSGGHERSRMNDGTGVAYPHPG
jgi:hypothetical protein